MECNYLEKTNYRIFGFFEVLKFREWLIFGFFTILFSQMGLPKAHTLQWVVGFFEGLNFTNDQHPQNLWNLRTSKKTNYTVIIIWLPCNKNSV